MRRAQPLKRDTFIYFGLAFLLASGIFLPELWMQFASIGLAVVAFGFAVEGAFRYYRLWQWEQYKQERNLENVTPDILLHQAQAEVNRTHIEYMKYIKAMSPDQLKAATILMPGLLDNYEEVPAHRYYTRKEAELVIYTWSEKEYGTIKLPSLHELASGSRQQNVVKAVTDDLLACGCASREKKNSRAYLTVSQDDAIAVLYGENE